MKPVFAAKTDFIDRSLLLILRNLLKAKNCPKIPGYRNAGYRFGSAPYGGWVCLVVMINATRNGALVRVYASDACFVSGFTV